ncbi:MAG: hypothetical protein ACW96U_10950 [Candidatus Heimdallarchaeaceae archaeon]
MVSKKCKICLVISLFFICSSPVYSIYSQASLPLEIRIIDLIYPPEAYVLENQNISAAHTNYQLEVTYNIRNPNDEVVSILMPNCYDIPFAHVNASFVEDGLRIFYGYSWVAMPCNKLFEPGLNENRSASIYFTIYSYVEEKLPNGFYTFWLNLNYSTVFYPTLVSYAFMNVTENDIEIIIEWGDKTEYYTRNVDLTFGFIIFPLVIVSVVIILRRNRKSKKYFI